ncbi:phosphoenolpyruvate-protein phosphotransferase [Anaeromyxobacter dehalogenans 2CP-1]|uniref:Phosphoenolpyruvate-protein phosphotransferase n=1 Tax=Anaeromyxobacter dehalogenans (strain ATCC BAA-258 / DSM 21875 / 2CP-1) TaxID=455488 RepID=B8J8T2_ANAD2|nr:phosphoenolpyruvate--protein phosphotransferase [Anaeromyxobacter dehalogenans]ACL63530.1 phosphoenolpyruvate-protein phosphotransferase [Anaeromyxobacter dehalogenans 2CP-1]
MSRSSATTLVGIGASPGIAIGRCWTIERRRVRTPKRRLTPEEVEAELARLRTSLEISDVQLAEVRGKVEESQAPGSAEHTAIIDMHRMMLKDEMLVLEAQRQIREERLNAEWAVKRATRKIKNAFHEQADDYFKERRADVDFVGERIIKNLLGQAPDVEDVPPEGVIVVAHDLSPADTALLLHEHKVAAFVTDAGAKTSHTAIVARALEVPAVVGVGRVTAVADRGDWIVVDGGRGLVVINPSPGERAGYEAAREKQLAGEQALLATRDLPARTLDDLTVRLAGNIEFAEEVPSLIAHGGEAVGLYRTEFLFMGRSDLPGEEEHYQNYRRILEALAPRPVTIRTFDLGGDKLPAGMRVTAENPALGLRAIRYCLRQPEMFRAQLRALLRASVHGNLRVMFPMISGVAELRAAKHALRQAADELRAEGVAFRQVPVGIMVELPSAAMIADRLAAECDFFSIGTNDLIQYTIGIDRQDKDVAYLYKPLHLAVLRLLKLVCDAGRAAGVPVSMCGEMAGEPVNALVLLGLGVAELSMNGPSIPLVKRVVRAARAEDGRALVDRLLALTTADDIEHEVQAEMARRFPGLLDGDDDAEPAGQG